MNGLDLFLICNSNTATGLLKEISDPFHLPTIITMMENPRYCRLFDDFLAVFRVEDKARRAEFLRNVTAWSEGLRY